MENTIDRFVSAALMASDFLSAHAQYTRFSEEVCDDKTLALTWNACCKRLLRLHTNDGTGTWTLTTFRESSLIISLDESQGIFLFKFTCIFMTYGVL